MIYQKIIRRLYKRELERKANVVGTGTGKKITKGKITDKDSVIVAVPEKKAKSEIWVGDIIPKKILGCDIDVVEVGDIRPYNEWREKHRPMKVGASCCSERGTACSAGLPLFDKEGNTYLLMNEHCSKEEGDAILNPSPSDGGKPEDAIGENIKNYGVSSKNDGNLDNSLIKIDIDFALEDVSGYKYLRQIRNITSKDVTKYFIGGSINMGHRKGVIISTDFEASVRWDDGIAKFPNSVLAFNSDKDGNPVVDPGCSSSIRFVDDMPLLQTFAGSEYVAIFSKVYEGKKWAEKVLGKKLYLEPQVQKYYVSLGENWYIEPILGKTKTTVRLNLRTRPEVNDSTYIKTLPLGTEIDIIRYVGRVGNYEWCEIKEV